MGLLKLSIIGAKYALERKQFYYPSENEKKDDNSQNLNIIDKIVNEKETRIIDYQLVHQRVVTAAAEAIAMRCLGCEILDKWKNMIGKLGSEDSNNNLEIKESHALISASKPYITHKSQVKIQEIREVLGGNGYSEYAGIGELRGDNDVTTTLEGDNNVLQQQAGKYLIVDFVTFISIFENLYKDNGKVFLKKDIGSSLDLKGSDEDIMKILDGNVRIFYKRFSITIRKI